MIGQYVQAESITGRTIMGVLREIQEPDYYVIDRDGGSLYFLPVRNTKSMVPVKRKNIGAVADPWNREIVIGQ